MSSVLTRTKLVRSWFILTRLGVKFIEIRTHKTFISKSDNLREKSEQRAEGQPRWVLGGRLRQPHVRDEDVRAGVSPQEDGGHPGRGDDGGGRPVPHVSAVSDVRILKEE